MKITVKISPNSKQDHVKEGGINAYGNRLLKVRTTASAQDGKANEALIKILAEYFDVKKTAIKIISGETARLKLIEIDKAE